MMWMEAETQNLADYDHNCIVGDVFVSTDAFTSGHLHLVHFVNLSHVKVTT